MKLLETVCSCDKCKKMCRRACWPTPAEAKLIMERGVPTMLDYWSGCPDIYIVCPAENGSENRFAGIWPGAGCVLQTADGLCSIHDIKPLEGRVASCKGTHEGLHYHVAKLWDTDEGKAVVEIWRSKHGF